MHLQSFYQGHKAAQHEKAYGVWKEVMAKYPPQRIVDIGTHKGGFSLFLLKEINPPEFYTYDITKMYVCEELDKYFEILDVFENVEKIGKIIQREGRTVLFCDGGNKKKEFQTFFPYLKEGDIIVGHDWGSEIHDADIKELTPLEVIYKETSPTKLAFFLR